jgi:hypothetical protein
MALVPTILGLIVLALVTSGCGDQHATVDGFDLASAAAESPDRLPINGLSAGTIAWDGLEWEKKDDGGGLHDKDNLYTWAGSCPGLCGIVPAECLATPCQPNAAASAACESVHGSGPGSGCNTCDDGEDCRIPDGVESTVWEWLVAVNHENGTGFAGRSDWRLPESGAIEGIPDPGPGAPELYPLRIADCSVFPCIPPVFHSGCEEGCSVDSCSCTARGPYLSSTIHIGSSVPVQGWVQGVSFDPTDPRAPNGLQSGTLQSTFHVRAVRDPRTRASADERGARAFVR